jgi:3-methyladenine DNA glycosylase AlkC
MASIELKNGLNKQRFIAFGEQVKAVFPPFDGKRFLALALPGLDALSLLQRVRRLTDSLRATLPADYRGALKVLRRLAPQLGGGFACFVPPDFVGQYGLDDFDHSMAALKFFTGFGTSEFAVRMFLRHDQARAGRYGRLVT